MSDAFAVRILLTLAAVSGFLTVAFGAFGAHGLQHVLDATQRALFETAVRYHAWHALALLGAGLAAAQFGGRALILAGWLFLLGTLLFSGSLYALALGGPAWLGPVTPIGGTALLAGWAVLALGLWRAAGR